MDSFKVFQRELFRTMERHRQEGLGWRYDGLESWTTEALFGKFKELGVDTDAERFVEQARAAGGINKLKSDWDAQLLARASHADFWRDFILIGIPVLWERLASDLICPEIIERRLFMAINAEEEETAPQDVNGLPASVGTALVLANYLQSFPASMRAGQFEEVNRGSFYDYTQWLLELIESEGPAHPDAITLIADTMSDCVQAADFQSELAVALAVAGRREEAISRARANVERYPEEPWVKIRAGDVYEQLKDDDKAIRLWKEVESQAEDSDPLEAAADRLIEALERTGREDELQELLLRLSRKPDIQPRTFYEPPPLARPDPLTRAKIVGRNDPCPCGSGKKYKKCCLP